MEKRIALLGSTGSIGKSTLQVARHLEIPVCALACHSNIDLLHEQIKAFHPEVVAVYDKTKALELEKRNPGIPVLAGEEGVCAVASWNSATYTVAAIVGLKGLKPTLAAIESGKDVGLAGKEVLVSAGEWVMERVRQKGTALIPIDSEHSALFQCLNGERRKDVGRLILTSSGGPFRSHTVDQLETVTLEEALAHPNWDMGPKVTIDSSTLMNKGLEVIEARWLFDVPPEQIDVVIHPQSIVHSMIEFVDGSIMAQLSEPNMIYPIQYALTYPERKPGLFSPFDFTKHPRLDFAKPNTTHFPALRLAFEALAQGKSTPCALNAANEVLVSRFLKKEFSWKEIGKRLERFMERHTPTPCDSLEMIVAVDKATREETSTL